MAKTRRLQDEPGELLAEIEDIEQTYYISAGPEGRSYVDDEAILTVTGRIEEISPRQKRHLGRPLEMSFVCANRYEGEALPLGKPLLFNINLRKDRCSFLIYLPIAPFWALPSMISSGTVTHVEARFAGMHHGSADLLSVYFARRGQPAAVCSLGS